MPQVLFLHVAINVITTFQLTLTICKHLLILHYNQVYKALSIITNL